MAVQGGFGAILKINTGSLTTIVNVEDIDDWVLDRIIAENTGHDASGGFAEFTPSGKRMMPAFGFLCSWDDSEATHQAIITNWAAETTVGFSVSDPDGTETLSFSGYIKTIARMSKQDGVYRAKMTLQPTGAITLS